MSREVVVVSDSLGETAEAVAKAALSQFQEDGLVIRKFAHVDSDLALAQVREFLQAASHAVVIYTVVLPAVRDRLELLLHELGILGVDVLGPALQAVATIAPGPPRLEAGLVHMLDEGYFRRVAAVEFAVRYDDGKEPSGCLLADVVILGVSRSSKTPLAMYLAHRQVRVANIPLVPEVALPQELYEVSPEKIVGLLVQPDDLLRIRSARLKAMGVSGSSRYADLERILEEMEYAEKTYRRLGCHVLDVTHRAVEETAGLIIELVQGGGRR
ncbi:MAG: pyruvate, water dikinase regulatory protein [Sulfobacillus sp.]